LDDVRPGLNYLVHINVESSETGKKYSHGLVVSVVSLGDLVGVSSDFPDEIVPGKDVKFSLTLIGNTNVVLEEVEVFVLSELFEERFSTPIFYKRTVNQEISFDIGSDVRPGTYTLSVKAYQDRKLVGSLLEEFEVVKNQDIEEVIGSSKSFLIEKISMRKTNTGNLAVEESFASCY